MRVSGHENLALHGPATLRACLEGGVMDTRKRLVTQLRSQLGDVTDLTKNLQKEGAAGLLTRSVRERAVVVLPERLTARGQSVEETRKQAEQVLAAGIRGLTKLQQQGDDADLTDEELMGTEAVVLLVGRPALFVVDNSFSVPPGPWTAPLEAERGSIETTLRSVGRIEVSYGLGQVEMIGTGFLVAPGVVMTNRHVVEAFCELAGSTWSFVSGLTPAIDYLRERDGTQTAGFRLVEVLGVHDSLDLALLRVSPGSDPAGHPMPQPLLLSHEALAPPEGRNVYVAGYPASDNQGLTPPQVLRDIFGDVYQVKRLQPGKIMFINDARRVFNHDCSTLGGNSGSCVVDLDTNRVVGLHFQGSYRRANTAVALWKLVDDPLLKKFKVRFEA
jgi:S1-C subfamily serine protease